MSQKAWLVWIEGLDGPEPQVWYDSPTIKKEFGGPKVLKYDLVDPVFMEGDPSINTLASRYPYNTEPPEEPKPATMKELIHRIRINK